MNGKQKIEKSKEEWRKTLAPNEFYVLRKKVYTCVLVVGMNSFLRTKILILALVDRAFGLQSLKTVSK